MTINPISLETTWRCSKCGAVIRATEPCWACGNQTPLLTEDERIRKIRRRVEDFLRKADNKTILKVAEENNIKTD